MICITKKMLQPLSVKQKLKMGKLLRLKVIIDKELRIE